MVMLIEPINSHSCHVDGGTVILEDLTTHLVPFIENMVTHQTI